MANANQPAPAYRCYDCGTTTPTDTAEDLGRLATEHRACVGRRPGCPDPIECDHEAAAGQALAEAEQLRAELDRTRAELATASEQVSVVLGHTYMEINDSMDPSQHDYAEAYNDGLEAAKRAAITAAPTT